MNDPQFLLLMSVEEGRVWKHSKMIAKISMENDKSVNYKSIAEELLSVNKGLGCSMSIKAHHPHSRFLWML